MPENLFVYAWRDNSHGGFIKVGTKEDPLMHLRNSRLEFNKCAVHFNATASPATRNYMRQITAIAQIATMAASSKEFRERCLKDVSAIQEVCTVVPVKIIWESDRND